MDNKSNQKVSDGKPSPWRRLSGTYFLFGVAMLLAVVGALTKYFGDEYNNFKIFCGVFDHLVAQTSLYAEYAAEYFDRNHYGPSFGPIIAPFAVLPRGIGLLLWMVVSVGGLFWALRYLPLERKQFAILFWLLVWDLYTAIANMQYNILITAFIIGGLLLFAAPLLRFKQYDNQRFRMAALASVCNFIVLFSNGSESSSYVLAFSGVVIWYFSTPTQTPKLNTGLLIFAFLLTSVSLTDVVPVFIRMEYIRPYALKALPCAIIWLKVVGEMLICDYAKPPQSAKTIQPPLS